MKLVQTIAGTRLDHGGTSRSVPALCDAMAQRGSDVRFVTTRPADPDVPFNLPAAPVQTYLIDESRYLGRLPVGRAYRNILTNLHTDCCADSRKQPPAFLVHDHGAWLPTNHAVAQFANRQRVIRVVSPRGMLSEWAVNHGRLKKRLAWHAYQGRDIRSATAFHATSEHEVEEIRRMGLHQPIALIPNGITLPGRLPQRQCAASPRRMLFLSRIHPVKGLINLVRAWKQAEIGSDWKLIIAGHNEGDHQKEIEREARAQGIAAMVEFPGSADEAQKWQMYVDADVFVLPSFSENFGIVAAEAMAAGLPVITTNRTPWHEVRTRNCGWSVEPNINGIAQALSDATSMSTEELRDYGQRGASWIRDEFAWPAISQRMIEFYEWLAQPNGCPEFVSLGKAA
jgi:glycosyltransferase involved in cell wall biosynthesis